MASCSTCSLGAYPHMLIFNDYIKVLTYPPCSVLLDISYSCHYPLTKGTDIIHEQVLKKTYDRDKKVVIVITSIFSPALP